MSTRRGKGMVGCKGKQITRKWNSGLNQKSQTFVTNPPTKMEIDRQLQIGTYCYSWEGKRNNG